MLYRRWKSQPELVLTALKRFAATVEVPDTGDLRDDLITLLDDVRRVLDLLPKDIMIGLMADTVDDPVLFDEIHGYAMGAGVHDIIRTLLLRAAERSQIEPGAVTARLRRLPIDLLRNDYLMSRDPLTPSTVTEIVDDIVMPLVLSRLPESQ